MAKLRSTLLTLSSDKDPTYHHFQGKLLCRFHMVPSNCQMTIIHAMHYGGLIALIEC